MIAPSNLRKWLLPALTAIVLASCGAPILTQDIETIFEPGGAAGAPAYYSLDLANGTGSEKGIITGAGAVGVAENVFLEASKYTVKVRARIETAFVEEVADALRHFVTDPQNGVLAFRAEPQVTVVHQEAHPMFLG